MHAKTRRICGPLLVACGTLIAAVAGAEPTRWDPAEGGNGHLYQAIRAGSSLSWDSARTAAKALGPGWDLATITSAEENAFVKSLLANNPSFFKFVTFGDPDINWFHIGPWIGGFNVRDRTSFEWVTGERASFADWGSHRIPAGPAIAYADFAHPFNGLPPDIRWTTATVGRLTPIAYVAERAELPSLALTQAIVAGCKNATGTVTIPRPAPPGGFVVHLSDTLGSASSPATATILAGATSTTFTIRTTPVDSSETGAIRAAFGSTTLSEQLTVRPIGMLYLTLSSTAAVGGSKVIGKARLDCKAAPGPIKVDLGSSNPAIASPVAASIVIPQGMQEETFDVTTSPVPDKTSVSIKATANGIAKSKKLTLNPSAAGPSASVSPTVLDFGRVPGWRSHVLNVTVHNKGTVPISVTRITLTGRNSFEFAWVNRCPASLNAGASCTIGVWIEPWAQGSKSATLSIETTARSTPFTVSLSASVRGAVP